MSRSGYDPSYGALPVQRVLKVIASFRALVKSILALFGCRARMIIEDCFMAVIALCALFTFDQVLALLYPSVTAWSSALQFCAHVVPVVVFARTTVRELRALLAEVVRPLK